MPAMTAASTHVLHADLPAAGFAPPRIVPIEAVRVLMVCAGNVRRSPMAAALWRNRFCEHPMVVQSAGLNALNGAGIDPQAEAALADRGLTARPHIARQVTAALVETSDLVLVMDCAQAVAVQALSACAVGRTFTLGKWSGGIEIPEPYPYTRDAYARVCCLIERAIDDWYEQLSGPVAAARAM